MLIRPALPALLIGSLLTSGCVTTVAPKRAAVTEGSDITFYPDACKKRGGIDGDVVFSGNGPLGQFKDAVCITGSLTIEASGLEALKLTRLSEIGGDLIIRDNGQLSQVDLPLLRLVGGAVLFLNVPRLLQVSLPELTVVGDHLIFGRHADLDAALSMQSPGTDLSNLELPALQAVGGAVVFRNNPSLKLFSLPKVRYVGDGLLIERNAKLGGFELSTNAQIMRTFTLDDNDALTELIGFQGRSTVQGSLRISGNDALLSLKHLDDLRSVGGDLHLSQNPRLSEFAMPALQTVGGSFEILGHEVVNSIEYAQLSSVGERLEISDNDSLKTVTLPALTSVGDNLDITANYGLVQLNLPVLTKIGADLGFVDNPALTLLTAPVLAEVVNNYVVKSNALLEGFDMPALTTVSGYVTIQDNPVLGTLAGLSVLKKIGVKLFVRDNPKLPECSAIALRDQLGPERPLWGEDLGDNDSKGTCE